ncbi:hypothetical protein XENOCAPTIV_011742 [Xenoophorus captivus]|uniref:Uncharacterized protein n=1 Tax=Xenoophorus captivus TaxID=1517983 RepID=A0ABV0RC65_9TELE
MGIAGIGGLRIHGNAGLQRPAGSRQHRGCSARPLADAAKPGALVSLSSEAIDRADQEADWGGELLAVRLESDPAGAQKSVGKICRFPPKLDGGSAYQAPVLCVPTETNSGSSPEQLAQPGLSSLLDQSERSAYVTIQSKPKRHV